MSVPWLYERELVFNVDSVAAGEMSQALDVVNLLLSSTRPSEPSPHPELPAACIATTQVTKPPAIPSVQSVDAQLVVGSKDKALRDAAQLFSKAAESLGGEVMRGEEYWQDALRLRKANWELMPRPLPVQFGAPTASRKGFDATARDFLVLFGLEEGL